MIKDKRVQYFRGRIQNFNQSAARLHCFLAPDWTLPQNTVPWSIGYSTLLIAIRNCLKNEVKSAISCEC